MIRTALAYPAPRFVLLGTVALAGIIAARLFFPGGLLGLPHQGPAPAPPPPVTTQAPETLATLASYTAITDRPLFIEARRPPAAEPVPEIVTLDLAATRAQALDGLTLTGIVMAKGTRLALVKPPSGETLRLAAGDDLKGWRVLRVEPDKVVLADGDQEKEIGFPKTGRGGSVARAADTANAPASRAEREAPMRAQ